MLKVLVLFWRLFPFELQTFRNPEIEFSNMLLAWQKILLFSKQETKKLKSFIPQRKSIILPVNLHTEIVWQNKKHRLELLEALNDYECFKTMQTYLKTIEQLRKYFQQKGSLLHIWEGWTKKVFFHKFALSATPKIPKYKNTSEGGDNKWISFKELCPSVQLKLISSKENLLHLHLRAPFSKVTNVKCKNYSIPIII